MVALFAQSRDRVSLDTLQARGGSEGAVQQMVALFAQSLSRVSMWTHYRQRGWGGEVQQMVVLFQHSGSKQSIHVYTAGEASGGVGGRCMVVVFFLQSLGRAPMDTLKAREGGELLRHFV